MSTQALLDVVERIRGRFYGKYRGSVASVDTTRGRITAYVPAVLGNTVTGLCDPCVPYAGSQVGIAFLPEVGSGVWIEFEGGDVSYPIWSGCYWRDVTAGSGEQGPEMPSTVAGQSTKVIQTKSGHKIILEDNDNGTYLQITDATNNTITLNDKGISLQDCNQNSIDLTSTGISIQDCNQNSIKLDATGLTLTDCNANTVSLAASGVTINDSAFQVLP